MWLLKIDSRPRSLWKSIPPFFLLLWGSFVAHLSQYVTLCLAHMLFLFLFISDFIIGFSPVDLQSLACSPGTTLDFQWAIDI